MLTRALAAATPALVLMLVLTASCARVVAPPPPAGAPAYSESRATAGLPTIVAAKAARVLRSGGFTTRRFGSDSTWATRPQLETSLRLRFERTPGDSTRVLLHLWLPCSTARNCGRAEAAGFFLKLEEDEPPPQ